MLLAWPLPPWLLLPWPLLPWPMLPCPLEPPKVPLVIVCKWPRPLASRVCAVGKSVRGRLCGNGSRLPVSLLHVAQWKIQPNRDPVEDPAKSRLRSSSCSRWAARRSQTPSCSARRVHEPEAHSYRHRSKTAPAITCSPTKIDYLLETRFEVAHGGQITDTYSDTKAHNGVGWLR